MAQSRPDDGAGKPANKFDPISVASAALSSSEDQPESEQDQSGGFLSRFRGRTSPADSGQQREDLPPDSWGRVGSDKESLDPLAVTRRALAADTEDADNPGKHSAPNDDDSGTPLRERLGGLVERARAAITPDQDSGGPDQESAVPDEASTGEPTVASEPSRPQGTAAPDSSSSDHEAGPDDPGWVFHRKVEEGGFEGWLYHYADGTMVDESGVVYEYPSHEPDSLGQDPSVGESDADHAEERTGEAPSRVAGQDSTETPTPETAAEPAALAEAAQEAHAPEHEAEDEGPVSPGEAPESTGQEAAAAEEAAPEEAAPEAAASGEPLAEEPAAEEPPVEEAAADKDDSVEAEAQEASSEEPAAEETPGAEGASEKSDDSADQSEEDASDDAPSMPAGESTGGPMGAVTEAVTGAWLNEKAEGKQALPPEGEASQESPAAESEDEPETVYVPRFIEYSPSNLLRYLSGGLFAVSSIAAVMTIFYAVQAASGAFVVLGGIFIAVALLASWVLLSWEPTVISIREGILEVAKGPTGEQVDLRDPRTKVDIPSNVGSPLWKMTIHRAGDKDVTIRAGQVKASQFAAIVRHHLKHPRKKPGGESESND